MCYRAIAGALVAPPPPPLTVTVIVVIGIVVHVMLHRYQDLLERLSPCLSPQSSVPAGSRVKVKITIKPPTVTAAADTTAAKPAAPKSVVAFLDPSLSLHILVELITMLLLQVGQ